MHTLDEPLVIPLFLCFLKLWWEGRRPIFIHQQTMGGICNIDFVFFDFINDHKMVAVPKNYTRKWCIIEKILIINFNTESLKTYTFCSKTNSLQRASCPCCFWNFSEFFKRDFPAIMLCHHAKAGRTTIHLIGLMVERKFIWINQIIKFNTQLISDFLPQISQEFF